MKTLRTSSDGFSAVELLITIIVAAMFTITLYQLFMVVNLSISNSRQKAVASDTAYAYLRRYTGAAATPSAWFTCNTATGSSNTNDYTINSNAQGSELVPETTIAVDNLPPPVKVKVTALALYGCSGDNTRKPLRIESSVTYGPKSQVVKHATLVGY